MQIDMLGITAVSVFMSCMFFSSYNLLSIQAPVTTSQNGTVQTNGHVAQAGSNSFTEAAGGIIPWFSQRAQTGTKQA